MSLRPIRRVMIGMPVKWMADRPTRAALRKHCTCGGEMWIEPNMPIKVPADCYVVANIWQCAACLTPSEFVAAMHNSGMLGYERR